ncbi:PREDICTED: basigin [Crocodylus porosus]|uniref:Basigin n=1 Tax=Crocodylus porosus TaxID=8502 RepID=A0A7M4FAH1_CROPO|nr:PREDICTED: basigin [Crocodylus porosus]
MRAGGSAAAMLGLALALVLLCGARGGLGADPIIVTTPNVTSGSNVQLYCNISGAASAITGHKWIKKEAVLQSDDTSSHQTVYDLNEVNTDTSGEYVCKFLTNPPAEGIVFVTVKPHVLVYKKSEHGNEGDTGVLICKCSSYPSVTEWTWYKKENEQYLRIVNGTDNRFFIKSSGNKTELHIVNLDIEKDPGEYFCNGTNEVGQDGATVSLRVRSRLAALWPFLGIVAEVLVLVTIIFIYEKRRKPDEVLDDDDGGSAPLKSNATNHKDKNVRQRNSN